VERVSSYSKRWKDIAEQEKREARTAKRKARAAPRDTPEKQPEEERAREERLAEWHKISLQRDAQIRATRARTAWWESVPWWGWIVGTLIAVSLLTGKPILSGCAEPNRTPEGNIICNDGWVSPSEGSGTCSHHGGISYGNGDPGP
jgi:hypothetical protein